MKKTLILSIMLLAVLASCNRKEQAATQQETPAVTTVRSGLKEYAPVLSFAGNVMANQEASLGATLPGRVEKIHYNVGSNVKKGEVIAELSDELLIQAEVEYDAIKKDYERISRLNEKGSISTMDLDHIKAKLEASEAKVKMMRKNTQVIAPFDGTVVDVIVKEGENYSLLPSVDQQNLSLNSGIVRLMQLNPVKVSIEVNEKDLSKITTGQKASIKLDALPGKSFTGAVTLIKPFLAQNSRTATVEISVSNPGGVLKPGMYATSLMDLPKQKGVVVPVSTVMRQPGTSNDFVFVVSQNKAHKVSVRQLQVIEDQVVVDGIAENTEIVNSGKGKLEDGAEIIVKNQ